MDEITTTDTSAIESEAKSLGWVPKDKFRGDPDRWTDAETFVKRGHELMPILQANNKRLLEQQSGLQNEVRSLKEALSASTSAIEELKEFHTADKRRALETQKSKLLKELKEAKADADSDTEVQLLDQLTDVNAALREDDKAKATKKEEPKPQAQGNQVDPAFEEWLAEPGNEWFGKDAIKTAAMIAAGRDLRRKGDHSAGLDFYRKCNDAVEEHFGLSKQTTSKVASGRGGAGGGKSGGQSYSDLPSDAKAACDRQGENLIGEGRAFKDEKAWRDYYTKLYFEE